MGKMRNTVLRQTLEHDVCWIWRFMLLGKWATDGYGGLHLTLAYQSQKTRSIRLGLRTCIGWGWHHATGPNLFLKQLQFWVHIMTTCWWVLHTSHWIPSSGKFRCANPHGDERNLRPFTSHSPPGFKGLNFPNIIWLFNIAMENHHF